MREQELILYRDFAKEDILQDMAWLMAHYQEGDAVDRDPAALLYDCMHRLLELAGTHGFYGNLWHCYLSDLLANSENSYSMACEVVGSVAGTIKIGRASCRERV